jgi:hypothetical protein
MRTNRPALLLLSLLCSTGAAMAQDYPTATFDTTMNVSSPEGSHDMRMVSDGKGRIRIEIDSPEGKIINIADYPGQNAYMVITSQKMAMKVPLDAKKMHMVPDEGMIQRRNPTSIGTKVIDGHPCHGYRYTADGAVTEAWIGDDIHYPVETTSKGPEGVSRMHLRTYSAAAPAAQLFQVPADCQLMNLPVGMFRMPPNL